LDSSRIVTRSYQIETEFMPAAMISPRPEADLVPFVRVRGGARIYRLPGSSAGPAPVIAVPGIGRRAADAVRRLGAMTLVALVYAGVFAFAWLLVNGPA
jgi:hypothetical protein